MSTPELLASKDAEMLASLGLRDYFRFIVLTVLGKEAGDRVGGRSAGEIPAFAEMTCK